MRVERLAGRVQRRCQRIVAKPGRLIKHVAVGRVAAVGRVKLEAVVGDVIKASLLGHGLKGRG